MSSKHFFLFLTFDPCEFDLKSSELKFKSGHVLSTTIQHVKYESSVIKNSSQDKEWKPFCFYKSDPSDLDL